MESHQLESPQVRPTFLSVLCVLTAIASALSLFFAILGIFNMEENIAQYYQQASQMPNRAYRDMMEQLAETMEEYGVLLHSMTIVTCVGGLYAAWAMWHLQRIGFWVYLPCELAPTVLSLSIFGIGEGFMAIMSAIGIVIALAFTAMYAIHLKYMD